MKHIITYLFLFSFITTVTTQTFVRTQLPTELDTPWEMTYGPDGYLWITEKGGVVSRVDPATGAKTIVYTAPDFFAGDSTERNPLCFMPNIGNGTLGLDLHPNFMTPASAYIYFFYSYNSGTVSAPETLWKVARLTWDWEKENVINKTDLVTGISNGYDHLGGRVMVVMREGKPYIFLTIGDHGISERNDPDCYANQADNPNNFTQDPNTDNGKIHRYNIDGTIPTDNPIPGNSFYTRGHRNPQGLMYIPQHDLLFDVEHGDRTDDEINLLEAGKNYGWKWVRGYHQDNNYPGEAEFIANYEPDTLIEGDELVEAFYSFCAVPQPETDEYLEWCTPAPSDGIYYNSDGIPEWKNSLLVVSLKNGTVTDPSVHVFRLTADGRGLMPSTQENPNPRSFFGDDQDVNGRLRDIAYSPDGTKIYLINNSGGDGVDKITIYTAQTTSSDDVSDDSSIKFFPNPASSTLHIESKESINNIEVYTIAGDLIRIEKEHTTSLEVSDLPEGIYLTRLNMISGNQIIKRFVKQ